MDPSKAHQGNERRRYPRDPVRQPATLESPQLGEIQVLVQNFCPGGLYASLLEQTPVANDTIARKLRPNDRLTVRLDLPDQQGLRCEAAIARIGELGFGIAFTEPQNTMASTLKRIAQRQGFVASGDRPSEISKADKKSLTEAIGKNTIDFVRARIAATIEAAKDDLLLAASKASANVGQASYFEAMSLLRKNGKALQKAVLDATLEQLSSFATLPPMTEPESAQQEDTHELALVDEKEFENFLILSDIIATSEGRNRQEIHTLEARLSALKGVGVDRRNNPMGPNALCHYYHDAVLALDFSHHAKQVLWRTYGRILATHLSAFYKSINKQLIDGGVLPNLKFLPTAPKRHARPITPPLHQSHEAVDPSPGESAAGAVHTGDPAAPYYGPVPVADPTPSTTAYGTDQSALGQAEAGMPAGMTPGATIIDLRRLLQQREQVAAAPQVRSKAGTQAGGQTFAMDELKQALSDLRSQSTRGEPLAARVDAALKGRFGKRSQRQMADQHNEAIFLAQELLAAIDTDEMISPRAKSWIQQLEIQVLHMLLRDDALLSDKDHPARRVINLLGHAVVGDNEELGPRERDMVAAIDQVVTDLAHMNEPDEAAFVSAAETLAGLLKRQQRLRDTHIKRVLEACDGQQRLNEARQQVQQAIDQRFQTHQIPRLLLQLLEHGWRQLLDVTAVRFGVDDSRWQEVFAPLAEIQELLAENRKPRRSDRDDSTKLLASVDEQLQQTGTDAEQREQLLDELKAALPGLGDGEQEVAKVVYEPPEPAGKESDPESSEADEQDPEQAHWLGRAKLLEEGSWLLHRSDDDEMQPIKLAWISDSRDRYVFVDRSGNKVLEVGPQQLARKLKADEADLIDQPDQPLVERSWHSMMQHMHEQIAHQATHDQLTGILNRKEFERQIRLKLGESKLMHSTHVALQIDIDQFKVINSTSGHEAGDQLLRDLGVAVLGQLQDDALCARLGGDEYAVLLPRCELGPGHEIADQVRRAIAEHRTRWKRRKLKATASIGLVVIERTSESVSQVLNQMSSACSAAKDAGRDRIKSYQIDDQELSQRDRAIRWVTQVEVALDNNRIELYGQQILPLSEGSESKEQYEILARMRTEDGQIIQPREFIPAAEAYGRVHYLDEWVFRRAFEMLKASPIRESIARLSLNISGKTFSRPRFLPFIHQLFDETGIEPAKICFEITETAAISNLSRCTDFLRELRHLGCRFSLDDFGTGLSSFNYLKHLPVDYLKIDGSFIKDVTNSPADFGLVKTINEIGHFLGKETIAEFVENDEILESLRTIGLDFVQGFGIARPRPLVEILKTE